MDDYLDEALEDDVDDDDDADDYNYRSQNPAVSTSLLYCYTVQMTQESLLDCFAFRKNVAMAVDRFRRIVSASKRSH